MLYFCDLFHALLVSSPFSCFLHLFRLRLFFHALFSHIKSLQIAFLHTSSLVLFIWALSDDHLIALSAHLFLMLLPCSLPRVHSVHIFPVPLAFIILSCSLSRHIFFANFHTPSRGSLFNAISTHLLSVPRPYVSSLLFFHASLWEGRSLQLPCVPHPRAPLTCPLGVLPFRRLFWVTYACPPRLPSFKA